MGISFGKNDSESDAVMDQNVFGSPHVNDMYSNMQNMWRNQMPNMNMGFGMMPQMQNWMSQAYGLGREGARDLTRGGSMGDTSDVRSMLMDSLGQTGQQSNTSKMYEGIVGGAGNSYIDPMVDAMRTGSFENLDRTKNYGAADAANMGQGGSSRHAMSDAMTNRMALQDMNQNEANMRGNAYDTDLNWKMDIAKLADSGIQQSQDRMMNMLGQSDQNTAAGMSFTPQMQNLSMGYMAPWAQSFNPLMNMTQMYGNMLQPQVLSSGTQSGDSSGFNFGFGRNS